MNIKEFYAFLEERLPRTLSATWDNDGIACCADETRPVRRVLLSLDATKQAVETAVAGHYDVLLTHHPLLFRGVKELSPMAGTVPQKLLCLVAGGVCAMSFHTRLDAVSGGVNDVLAGLLGLEDVESFAPVGEVPCGRVGNLPRAVSAEEFAAKVKEVLGARVVLLSGSGTVRRVAVLGGEGADFVAAAKSAGADLFLAGRIGYHRMLDGGEEGMCLIEAGHYLTEVPVLSRLEQLVREADATIEIDYFRTPGIRAV